MAIKFVRIEVLSGPFKEFLNYSAFSVFCKPIKELLVAMASTGIVGWACAFASFDESTAARMFGGWCNAFDCDGVLPAIAEIVQVAETRNAVEGFVQFHAPLIDDNPLRPIFRMWCRIQDVTDLEFVQMSIGPPHHRLYRVVQLDQGGVALDPEAPPDRWSNVFQFNSKLVQAGRA